MTLFFLAFVVGFCSGLATWALAEMNKQYVQAQEATAAYAHQSQQGYR